MTEAVLRGLFERDKIVFRLLVALRVLVSVGVIRMRDVALVTAPAGAATPGVSRVRSLGWLTDAAWANAIGLAAGNAMFADLLDMLLRSEGAWRTYVEDASPERLPLPSDVDDPTGPPAARAFARFLLVRCLREDRMVLAAEELLAGVGPVLGLPAAAPPPPAVEAVVAASDASNPVIFLLSAGQVRVCLCLCVSGFSVLG